MQSRLSVAWLILASFLVICAFTVLLASRGPTVRQASAPTMPRQSAGGTVVWPPDRGLPPGLEDVFPYTHREACPSIPIAARLVVNDAMLAGGRFDVGTISLALDGRDVSTATHARFSTRDAEVAYRPPDVLAPGRHEVRLKYPVGDGVVQEYAWTFQVRERECSPYPADDVDVPDPRKSPLTWTLAREMEDFLTTRATCPTPTLS